MASTTEPVHPLRIQKGTPATSPTKSPGPSLQRPLSELGATSQRRNSPSFSQSSKKTLDSSPFQSSPFNASEGSSSPRLFWQGRDPATPNRLKSENELFPPREFSPSPTRRSSIERLQKASRVKNSNMYAREQKQEYDPTSVPVIERPLAKTVYGPTGIYGRSPFANHKNESKANLTLSSPTKSPIKKDILPPSSPSPSKNQASPTKSSLSSRYNPSASVNSQRSLYSEDNSGDERQLPPGRSLHRHAKSVTFDAAPPQVNEYEMVTPDISSVGSVGSREDSYDSDEDEDEELYHHHHHHHGDSFEQDDSFDASLEDTDKTPVVGPDDWRHASPANSHDMVDEYLDDPFDGPEGSPMPDARPAPLMSRQSHGRTDSLNSNGEHRPLPPLPGKYVRSGSMSSILSGGMDANSRTPPPPAAISKSDLQSMSGSRMSLEERLRLMMIGDDEKPKTPAEEQRERRMRRAGARERSISRTPERENKAASVHGDDDGLESLPDLGTYQLPPRISRESILRKINGQNGSSADSDYNFSSPVASSSPDRPERPLPLDPDTPLPSTEVDHLEDSEVTEDSIAIKSEPDDDNHVDVYDIPEMYQGDDSASSVYDQEESVIHHDIPMEEDDDDDSEEEEEDEVDDDEQATDQTPTDEKDEIMSTGDVETPRATSPVNNEQKEEPVAKDDEAVLPDFGTQVINNDFSQTLQPFVTPSPPISEPQEEEGEKKTEGKRMSMSDVQDYLKRPETPEQEVEKALPKPDYDGSGWGPEEEEEFDTGTPDSVLLHPIVPPSPPRESPSIPEHVATIKSSGSKLKTRPSATPADLQAMREIRRQVSGSEGPIPPIPQRHQNRPSLGADNDADDIGGDGFGLTRQGSFKKKSLTLDIGGDLGLSLDKDFDRVIEAQKVVIHPFQFDTSILDTNKGQRGYLMRQNTKIVVASSDIHEDAEDEFRGTRSAGNSPVKRERPQSWTVEPWNGQPRKSSNRVSSNPRKKPAPGAVPPLPGQESNATGLGIVTEDPVEQFSEEGGERGRLFVKVIGVKELDLPLPKNERSYFSLTLDNGVHCVTTAWLELGKNAPIGQEFELVVPNDLEFQLTLNAKLEKPAPKHVPESPPKTAKAPKPSTFSRVFASPKKRKELEMKQKEEEQRIAQQKQRDAQAKKTLSQPTTWDLLSPLAAEDGSFGRSYVSLKDHEVNCYGRPYVVDVACFNEWATEESNISSSARSKRSANQVQRRAPYKIGKLELQLLFVPKPKGATDDDMPKSMNACIREMKDAEAALARNWEGILSQQGGDCPYWRRRFFKLKGSKLTAYHESTRQPRATINLANACKLIDDRSALTQKETSGRGGTRRKSGFAEEEEGYMFVEEGFRIRFNNGEVIDFYADSRADKEGWMKVLDACIGKESEGAKNGWCSLVLKREESLRKTATERPQTAASRERHHQRTRSMIV
ncbi:hypothetical protein F5884DRAFT_860170 [Xylogone sp. PMI_703]|nr:hypothetical protein F5884DRAFT_860170 [Xylogone sp. PMI_703]